MGCLVAKLEDRETWIVYQSSSDSVFAPMFNTLLKAEMFANIYQRVTFPDISKYEETAQMDCALQLTMFVEEMMPEGGKYNDPQLPQEWREKILKEKHGDDDEDEERETRYEYDDLMSDIEVSWKSNRVNVIDMMVGWFYEWQEKRKVKA